MTNELPTGFVEMLRSFGDAYAEPLLAALDTAPSVSVRANALKGAAVLPGADIVPWCSRGFYLDERPLFVADPAWHQGLYYVQDASSMVYGHIVGTIVDRYFKTSEALRYLDACAAPGGKTIAALEALPADSLIVANELDRHRANILLENIAKEGSPNVAVCRGDAARLGKLKESFDIIAVDAPCSGEGMMRKEPEAIRQWSQGLIDDCASLQREILSALWAALRPGGVLIYSTCTFNRSENEENISFIADTLGGESIDLGLDKFDGVFGGINTDLHCYRFAPGHVRGEGLFVGALRKPGEDAGNSELRAAKSKTAATFADHIVDADKYIEVATKIGLELRSAIHSTFIDEIAKKADVLRGGLPLATVKGRDMIPNHEFAISTAVRLDSYATLDLDYAAAMAYLRGESINEIPEGLPKGIVLVCYNGRPLGFAKNIGRRANNLYPDALRLRLDPRKLPSEAPTPIITLK